MQVILAYYFTFISIIVTIFQIALFFGAPLGAFTLGGKYKGVLPKEMRWVALVQIVILLFFVYVVSIKSNLLSNHPSFIGSIGIWIVTLLFLFGSIVNISSPSKKERILWGPVNLITFIALLIIAVL